MQTNVGNADRTLRLVAGVAIIALGVVFQSWWGAIGLIPLFTGTTRWCPAYLPFGISTCKASNPRSKVETTGHPSIQPLAALLLNEWVSGRFP